ncbi:hypothetical protein ACSW8S_17405 (plasmid) [Clostridium perfringens]
MKFKTINIIQCPHCKELIEPWDFVETGDMEGDFTLECTNPNCQKEFNVEFKTEISFTTEA